MFIYMIRSCELGTIVAQLVREGIGFNVTKNGEDDWTITLTGAY